MLLYGVPQHFYCHFLPNDTLDAHKLDDPQQCRCLVPDNTQKILTEIWHHFWLKNDGEKWSRKKYFKIPRRPSELLLPSAKKSAQKG